MSATTVSLSHHAEWPALRQLIVTEFKSALRIPLGIALGVLVPLIMLVIFGLIPAFQKDIAGTSTTLMTSYVPILIGIVVTMIGLISLPGPIVRLREQGFIRRLSTTPMPPRWLLAAQMLVNLVLAVVATTLVVVGSLLFFHVAAPEQLGGFIVSAILAMAALFSLGLLMAAIAPNTQFVGIVGTVLFYPLTFLAGLWIPRETMSGLLRTVSDYSPLGAAHNALLTSMQGTFPPAQALLAMAAYVVVFGFLAVRFFRWE